MRAESPRAAHLTPGPARAPVQVTAPNVTSGATVMYSKYSGTEFEEGDDAFIVVRESDILAQLD